MSERRQLFFGLLFALLAVGIVIGSAIISIVESDPKGATRTAAVRESENISAEETMQKFLDQVTFQPPHTPDATASWVSELFHKQLTAIAGTKTVPVQATPSP